MQMYMWKLLNLVKPHLFGRQHGAGKPNLTSEGDLEKKAVTKTVHLDFKKSS